MTGGAQHRFRRRTVLTIGFAMAPVGPDAVGGSEQIMSALDHALVAAGHRSIVVACRGSRIAGEWVDTGVDPERPVDDARRRDAQAAVRAAAAAVLARERVDLVHAHGLDFADTLPASAEAGRLVTLHLPPEWYPRLADCPGDWLHCVSAAQQRACQPDPRLMPYIPNGVPVEALDAPHVHRRAFVLHLGRVCHEKGQHIALDVAHRTGTALLLGGEVFPYPAHRDYFATEVVPRLDRRRRFLGPLGFRAKRRLISAAAALLVPSLANETSSLVAMEAAACGTPVVALRAGALPEVVEHGRTGFLVDDADGMAAALARLGEIDPDECRAVARRRFSRARMVADYMARYDMLWHGVPVA